MVQNFHIAKEDAKGCLVRIGTREMLVAATKEQLEKLLEPDRPAVHTALPQATADQREFLISGMLPDEFDNLMGTLEEE